MSDPFSDDLPTRKGDRPNEPKPVLGERFAPWVEEGFKAGRRREARPMLRLLALMIIIVCLAWGAKNPENLTSALVGPDHPRAVLPIGLAGGEAPPWTEENLLSVIHEIQPRARQCLEGWAGMAVNEEGMVVVEVVLTPEGPDEAAIYDQVDPVPDGIQSCLGSALGSQTWPIPEDVQSVHFPILGGPS